MSHLNNPFAAPSSSSTLQSTANRFPDISQDPQLSNNQYQQPQQQQQFNYQQPQPTGYSSYQQSQPLQPPQQQPPLFGAHNSALYQQPQQTGFQPPSAFGQQQQQYGQYQSNQPSQLGQGYQADLDPYGNLGQLGQTQPQQHQQQPASAGPAGQIHPRQYVHEHKAGLTNWDAYEVRSPACEAKGGS